MIVAGIGCRPKVDEQSLLDLIMQVTSGRRFDRLAAPEFRKAEPAIPELAKRLNVELVWIDTESLMERQVECETHSAIAFEKTGFSSVAEACALAGAGPKSRLIVMRQSEKDVTCALAQSVET
ncbi:cobalamin biosynthesis protein [Gluconobacter cerinus]|uniref:Cobalamin biosynthesis domain-containing protein n=1 Tax=Gluconobacter cerinus TaxID=38307 RepID=A0A1B6VL19_9PROT|nr:cobalamin biosynthesis protein [Gluconobacter cerinus]OAJ67657.1 cobalamin biosynthesis domain-containing protein [Gluconobacter cerinus]